MIRLGIYLAVGALLHLVFVGPRFDWSSAITWLWLVGWPLMLLVSAWIFAAVVGVGYLIWLGATRLVKG